MNLNKNGIFLFPVISLSNEKKILKALRKNFINSKIIKTQTWPMPIKMSKKINQLNNLKKKGIIYFENKLGILTFKTDIYMARNE